MPRVTLAHWHDGRPPGTELDVTDDELRALKRDGRIAPAGDTPDPEPEPEAALEEAEPPAQDLPAEEPATEETPKRRRQR
ncbi:hypothetical protein [Streptomyces sp. NPDC020489]|uniref:hypothetical protein n=1 Tax=Streptomyces sp. NPDC020489 TaxID=3365077 RepID=UPI0037AAEC61